MVINTIHPTPAFLFLAEGDRSHVSGGGQRRGSLELESRGAVSLTLPINWLMDFCVVGTGLGDAALSPCPCHPFPPTHCHPILGPQLCRWAS